MAEQRLGVGVVGIGWVSHPHIDAWLKSGHCDVVALCSRSEENARAAAAQHGLENCRIYTDYDFQLTSNWLQNLADPVIGIDREYSSWSIKKGTVFVNATGWSSPETDKLMKDAAVEIDPKKRGELYHQFQKLVVDAVPLVWVFELQFVTVYDTKFKNLVVSPLGTYSPFNAVDVES